MTNQELESLIKNDEGGTVEFKETAGQRVEGCRTLCAFLNGHGGAVVFGVTKKGKIVGQLVSDETKKDLARAFYDFEPGVVIDVSYVQVDETHQAIVCKVNHGPRCPYVYDGRPYKRVESTTVKMPQEEYEELLKSRTGFESKWESKIADGFSLDDIDVEEVKATARKAIHAGRLDESVDAEDVIGLLDHFKVRKNGKLLNAAAALFGKVDVGNYPQCQLKMGWFKGACSTAAFSDIRHEYGHIGRLMSAAMAFCFKHLNLSAKIQGIERDEDLEIPAAALREALINAFAHRSYENAGASVYLAIFEDRVEIKNPGAFPKELDVRCLFTPPKENSIPRNLIIADVLYLRKSIETWGRGFGVMAEECRRVGVPLPEIEVRGGYVVLTFRRLNEKISGSHLDQNRALSDPDLGTYELKLLSAVRENPLISRRLLAEEIGVSERKVRNIIKTLRDNGVILRQGADHGGIWRVSRLIQTDAIIEKKTSSKSAKTVGKKTVGKDEKTRGKKTVGKSAKTVGKKTADNNRVVVAMRENPRITREELATQLNVTLRGIEWQVAKLQKDKVIRRVGGRKFGSWEVLI